MKNILFFIIIFFLLSGCSNTLLNPQTQNRQNSNLSSVEKKVLLQKANILNNKGVQAYKKGDYKTAIKYYKQAIAIKEHILGENDLSTATSYNI